MMADATGSQAKTLREFIEGGVLAALDVGCGTGAKTFFIARHAAGTIGIDPNPGDVREAQNRYGGRRLDFLVARAERLCFADGSFGAVFFNESLHHVPIDCQEAALRESHRVLKSRGRMLITEPIHGSGCLGQTLRLYRDERAPKQHAIEAIRAVVEEAFALQAQTEMPILYRFNCFEDFYAGYLASQPDAAGDCVLKRNIRKRFDRCPRNTAGDTLIDYAASVWHLVKK